MDSAHKFSFEKLEVWQLCRELSKEIYKGTKTFPDHEKFGLTNQMRRAAVSVCSNIVEGSSRTSQKDQAHFYQIAYSSLMELLNQIIISTDLEFIDTATTNKFRTNIEKIANKLNALRKSRLNN